ncbi:MAG: kelch repeat-containing protein, partial [Chitinophagaceae bacterium]
MIKYSLLLIFFIIDCACLYAQNNQWTWVKGDSTIQNTSYGVYGVLGVASPTNKPGSRNGSVQWTDASGNMWLFGGFGYGEAGTSTSPGDLNDLWRYNPTTNQWTWMKGDKIRNQNGIYGTITTPDLANKPGSRRDAISWIDATGNLWLFGGSGYGETNFGSLNDLWRYSPATNQWTWIKGDKGTNINGTYGTLGLASIANKPGSRHRATSWKDASGNFWLMGGSAYAETSSGSLNDLWRYNPTTNQWTWMKGDKTTLSYGVYGVQGIAAAANKPGGRNSATCWTDLSGNFWLLGGTGYLESGSSANLNDLWRYNVSTNQWTWMKGDKTGSVVGVYGTQGIAAAANKPGARRFGLSWIDATGVLWLYGGSGFGETGFGLLNDLWKYNTSTNQWTWVKGSKAVNVNGVFGVQGVATAINNPDSKSEAAVWRDAIGNLWLFGGSGTPGRMNDLWKYNISTNQWTWVRDYMTIGFSGIFGTQGTAENSNKPGSRNNSITWTYGNDFWLFGGSGVGSTFSGALNDLWKYNSLSNQWSWVKGDSTVNLFGVYGTIGVSAVLNNPGAREDAVSWKDASGNLWLFGGIGNGETANGRLNDLWKYSPANNQWTWVRGNKSVDINGVFGTQGTANAGNNPGSRSAAVSWIDASGNLWLFGGYGFGETGSSGYLNDLWKYSPATNQWTWVNGENTIDRSPYTGPGGIMDAVSWRDANDNMWLFGGYGYDSYRLNGSGYLNDLWKYTPSTNEWLFVKGDGAINKNTRYGTMGVDAETNSPGGRTSMANWQDQFGNLWLFSGDGAANKDLWKFDTTSKNWTWIKGENNSIEYGIYGTLGVSADLNTPGKRGNAAAWKDAGGNFWLLGGYGYPGSYSNYNVLNDLWKFSPCINKLSITPETGNFCLGISTITLTVTGGILYEWYKDGIIISGESGSSLNASTPGSYYAKSLVGSCTVFSKEVSLGSNIVTPTLSGNGVYCEGEGVSVGMPDTEKDQTYRWIGPETRYIPIGGGGGNQSLNFAMEARSSGSYFVESTKPGCNTVYTNSVAVYYGGVTNLSTLSVCSNQVSFSWTDYGSPVKRFQYAVTFSSTPPAIGSTVTSTSASVGGLSPSTTYYIHVRGASIRDFDLVNLAFCNTWTTTSFTTPANPLTPTLTPASATICQGNSQLLTASGGNSYQWLLDNNIINGVTSATYTATLSGVYKVRAYNSGCDQSTPLSNASTITFTLPPAGTISPASASICSGGSQLLTATGGTSYQWYRDGTIISGEVNATYSANLAGNYTVTIFNGGCSGPASNNSIITLSTAPTGTISPTTAFICTGGSQILTATGGTSYQWFKDGTIISGEVNATYSANLAGTYTVTIFNGSCSGPASNNSVITLSGAPSGTISPATASICTGGSQLLTATGGTSYQWYKDGTIISGEVNATYSANLAG